MWRILSLQAPGEQSRRAGCGDMGCLVHGFAHEPDDEVDMSEHNVPSGKGSNTIEGFEVT